MSEQQEVSCIEGEVREYRHLYALRAVIDDAITKTRHRREIQIERERRSARLRSRRRGVA